MKVIVAFRERLWEPTFYGLVR